MNRITQQISLDAKPVLDRIYEHFRHEPGDWLVLFKPVENGLGPPSVALSCTFMADPRYSAYTIVEPLS